VKPVFDTNFRMEREPSPAKAAVLEFDPKAFIQNRGRNIAVVSPRLGYAVSMTGRRYGEENAWRVAKTNLECS